MIDALPDLYFRIRENGASVFHMLDDARNGRVEMKQIATVNLRSGEVRVHGDIDLSPDHQAAINTWMEDRQESLPWRRLDRVMQTVEDINLTAQWAQSDATDKDLEGVTDALFLAMHDLRQVLVRKASERLTKGDKAQND